MSNPSSHDSMEVEDNAKKNIQWKTGNQKQSFPNQNFGKNRKRFRTIKNVNKKSKNSYEYAKAEYERIRSEKKAAKERRIQRKQEIETALNAYKQKKKLKNQKLSAKTSKGQPIMKNRIEMLLDKIQQTVK